MTFSLIVALLAAAERKHSLGIFTVARGSVVLAVCHDGEDNQSTEDEANHRDHERRHAHITSTNTISIRNPLSRQYCTTCPTTEMLRVLETFLRPIYTKKKA